MKNMKQIFSIGLAAVISVSCVVPSYAAETKTLTVQGAVEHGIKESKALDAVELEIELARNSKERGSYKARKLERGDKDLKSGSKDLGKAEDAYKDGKTPQDINMGGVTIPAGTDIGTLPADQQDAVKKGIEKSLEDSRKQLDKGGEAIANALEEAGAAISDAINFASLNTLDIDSSANLIELMPEVAFEVTQASFDMYKNSVALLIEKSYYDVLQAQEMVKVKQRAMDRGKKQYDFVKAAFDEGMKAKDDLLMAEVYYKSTKIAYEKAQGDLKSSIVELKKNASLPMDSELKLETVMATKPEDFDLNQGLTMGMEKRLEMKKSAGEVIIYTTSYNDTKKSYTPNTFQYKEAELLQKKSMVKYEQAKEEVDSSIRKSHTIMNNTAVMLNETNGLVKNAKENLDIANYKYQEGFGVNTSMLSSMNLQDLAGTIVEVLAAEEKLAEIEENVVKITYAYNLSRMQYKNNIGDYIY